MVYSQDPEILYSGTPRGEYYGRNIFIVILFIYIFLNDLLNYFFIIRNGIILRIFFWDNYGYRYLRNNFR